ncbi:SNF2-related protein [[Mycoplasma] anseris]|uniref:ATP-dependent helicase n=1 Tax=[Mycoplasma] anseris TaxID=92400 RepID=A0A2Z4NDQ5_9BACT|nr:DEAD/DEAH box helicase [[Mycoplasma] anseris]AWX69636.1 ATP-dependent helicase [[Mycoplasma] anseris]
MEEIHIDIENNCTLVIDWGNSKNDVVKSLEYKISGIDNYVDNEKSKISQNLTFFKKNLSIRVIKNILNSINDIINCFDPKIILHVSEELKSKINKINNLIEDKINLGTSIKSKEFINDKKFNSFFIEFKNIVNKYTIRNLTETQYHHAFFAMLMKNSANFSVPGAGKTASILATYAYLYHKNLVDKILVICPKNAFNSWINEWKFTFGNKLSLNFHIFNNKKTIMQAYIANLVIVNYEKVKSNINSLHNIINEKTLVVFDEVHKIKNPKGIYATACIKLIENTKVWGTIQLSGTPIPNSYEDIYNSSKLIYGDERNHFFNYEPIFLRNITRTGNVSQINYINAQLFPFYVRASKKELNVPEPLIDKWYEAKSSSDEEKLVSLLKQYYKNNFLLFIIRLMQLESYPKMLVDNINEDDLYSIIEDCDQINDLNLQEETQGFSEIIKMVNQISNSSKCERLLNLVIDLISQKKQVIIWCIFTKTIDHINDILLHRGIISCKIYGSTKEIERKKIINSFNDKKIDVIITNPHTLAESVSFHKVCHDAIYYDLGYNLVHFLQSKNRINRLGLTKEDYTQYHFISQTYSNILLNDNLMHRIYDKLTEKERIMLDAIENNKLEFNSSLSKEEIIKLFKDINLD